MTEDISGKTKTGLIWNTSLRIVWQAFRFIISIIIARILDPEDFGIMGMATIVIFYANSITNFGFNLALIQRKDIKKVHIDSVFTINIAISSVLTICTIIFSTHIARFFNTPELADVLLITSSVFILTSFYNLPKTLLQRDIDFKSVAIVDVLRGIIQAFITLSLAILGYQYWSLIAGLIASYIAGILYLLVKVEWKPRIQYSHDAIKDIFHFGIWAFIRSQIYHLNEYVDKFFIGKFLGPASLGFYEKAYSTAAMVKENIGMRINAVMFSSFSRIRSEENDRIKKYFKRSLAVSSAIIFPVCVGLFALGTHFIIVLLGSKWESAIVPLKVLSIAAIIRMIVGLVNTLNVSLGHYISQAVREGISALVLVILVVMVVNKGIEFVASAILIKSLLTLFVTFQLTKKSFGINWTDMVTSIIPSLISSLGMLFVVVLSEKLYLPEINAINFIILTSIGAFTYFLLITLPRYSILEEYRADIIAFITKAFHGLSTFSKGEN